MTYETARAESILAALADPMRRAIVTKLRGGPMAVQALAKDLPVSRPAVSQHLRVLSDAGLLDVTQTGTRRIYHVSPAGVDALRSYLDQLWDDALGAFAATTDTNIDTNIDMATDTIAPQETKDG